MWGFLGLTLVLVLGLGACTPDRDLSDEELFRKYCSDCHGDHGEGVERFAEESPNVDLYRSPMVEEGDRERVHRRIARGYGPMPAYVDKVAPEDLERLVEFVLRLGGEDKPPPAEPGR
jgi:mono/diheme cytochrome c family protein